MNLRYWLLEALIIGLIFFSVVSCWGDKICYHEWKNLHHKTVGIFGYGHDFRCKKCGIMVHSRSKKKPQNGESSCSDCGILKEEKDEEI